MFASADMGRKTKHFSLSRGEGQRRVHCSAASRHAQARETPVETRGEGCQGLEGSEVLTASSSAPACHVAEDVTATVADRGGWTGGWFSDVRKSIDATSSRAKRWPWGTLVLGQDA